MSPANGPPAATGPGRSDALWRVFQHDTFTVLWIATLVSNVGTWMQNAAAGWLMTGLSPEPALVALVQVATTLPMFLFGLIAGALADIFDKRRVLILVQTGVAAIVAILGILVWLDRVTPWVLLIFTFMSGVGAALIAPSWQAIVPMLVPRADLAPAIALNAVGFNISRAVGPALAGLIIAGLGLAAPFWLNAVSFVGVIAVLAWWRPPAIDGPTLPAERLVQAMRIGLRHARHNRHLKATLFRAGGFFLFASAYWALLPLIARLQVGAGPQLYGIMLGVIGAGAVAGAFVMPRLKQRMGPDHLVTTATAGTAASLVLFAVAREPVVAMVASFLAGMAWIAALAMINVSAQIALPPWVRGRGLSVYVTVQFGAMAAGSLLWGYAAGVVGLPTANLVAAAGAIGSIPLLWRYRLQTAEGLDLTPSMHWPTPVVTDEAVGDRGPVMVTIEYRIARDRKEAFVAAMEEVAGERRRDGAYAWNLFEDAADAGRFLESFLVDSWLEHQRQHLRVTRTDADVQARARAFHAGPNDPIVRHFIAARR